MKKPQKYVIHKKKKRKEKSITQKWKLLPGKKKKQARNCGE